MSRRHRAERREITPDAKFGDLVLAKTFTQAQRHAFGQTARVDENKGRSML